MYEGVLSETLVYKLYIRERNLISLDCRFEKTINFFEVKTDIHKRALRFGTCYE